ncbi:(5-formylfuran-3-yl)methyl phosphate synthase [Thalassoglobus sp. JC818]|uniref:(5-formylfuran-3-yl)methyl phosphate synthase n=1 Tax=Thalassoglobus sp. JC818 TaxID=3232136 RepID=UPI00345A64A6
MQLLVSVRNSEEASVALSSGVNILDFKDPSRGSLGAASGKTIEDCLCSQTKSAGRVLITVKFSCACGEVSDASPRWREWNFDGQQIDFLKLGLSGLRSSTNWTEKWNETRQQIEAQLGAAEHTSWIAVAYADELVAQSPPIEDVISAAADFGCAGVLIDTYSKQSGRLREIIPDDVLENYCHQIQSHDLFCALAGRLQLEDIAPLSKLPVDIVAVRTAACQNRDRTGPISEVEIRSLLNAISDPVSNYR